MINRKPWLTFIQLGLPAAMVHAKNGKIFCGGQPQSTMCISSDQIRVISREWSGEKESAWLLWSHAYHRRSLSISIRVSYGVKDALDERAISLKVIKDFGWYIGWHLNGSRMDDWFHLLMEKHLMIALWVYRRHECCRWYDYPWPQKPRRTVPQWRNCRTQR